MDAHARLRETATETSNGAGDRRVPSEDQSSGSPGMADGITPREAGSMQAAGSPRTSRHYPFSTWRGIPHRDMGGARLAEEVGKGGRNATQEATGHSLKYIMEAGPTQAVRRLNEGSSHSPLPPTDGGNRLKRLAGGGSSPGREPGVLVRVVSANGRARSATLSTIQQARPNTTLRH